VTRSVAPIAAETRGLSFPPFFSDPDRELCKEFHASRWEDRLSLLDRFEDTRLRRLGRRLIYFEPALREQTLAARRFSPYRRAARFV
jgi:hypothetical protein